jgi:hypothetical protein
MVDSSTHGNGMVSTTFLTHTFERANKRNIGNDWRKIRKQISNMVQESGLD